MIFFRKFDIFFEKPLFQKFLIILNYILKDDKFSFLYIEKFKRINYK